jgi:tetratricopeptide (TPR) repeat protein
MIFETAKLGIDQEQPWLDEFAADPRGETARLLAGLASIGSFRRADPSDAATLLFEALPEEDPRRKILGKALVEWLDERRAMSPRDRAVYGLDSFVREVSDAFRIIWRLGLTGSALQLRKDFEVWDSWARPLMLTPARDARRAFLRMCALMQVPLDDSQLEFVWLGLCQVAGRELSPAYLDVGLLGLRRMPSKQFGADPAARAVMGLALWAKSIRPSRAEFLREWRALKALYVRTQSNFVEIVNAALDATEKGGRERFQAAEWWRRDIKAIEAKATVHKQPSRNTPPTKARADAIVRQLQRSGLTEGALTEIESLMKEHERYAAESFDSFFLVRGAGVLAAGLLKIDDRRATDIALRIVRRALQWDINDAHKWSLWHQALSLKGDRKSAEYIGWEAIRRFPENPVLRVQLSGFLADDSVRQAEAWSLIVETVNRFPDAEHAWTQLALLMKNMPGYKRDAEGLLSQALQKFPENLIIRKFHASLLLDLGKTTEAGRELDLVERNFKGRPDTAYYAIRFRWAFQMGGAELLRTYLIDALEKHPGNVEYLSKLDALRRTGKIEEEEQKTGALADDIGVADVELFETVDITRISSDQSGSRETAVAVRAGEDAVAGPIEKVEPIENTAAGMNTDQDLPPREVPGQNTDTTAIDKQELPRSSSASDVPDAIQETQPPKSAEPERKGRAQKQKPARLWAAPLADMKNDPVYVEALRYGRAKGIDYALNGAGLEEGEKKAAREDLNQLLNESKTFGYGYLVKLRRVNPEVDDQVWQGLGREDAIFLQHAWQTEDAEKLDELAAAGRESLLVQCAAALLGDQDAQEKFVKSITSYPVREGRGSRALRLVLSAPLKRKLESDAKEPVTLFEAVEELIADHPSTVAEALTEAIDATFDYFGTERWVGN